MSVRDETGELAPGHAQSKEKIRLNMARKAHAVLADDSIIKTLPEILELMNIIERCTHKEFRRKAKKKKTAKKQEAKSPFD